MEEDTEEGKMNYRKRHGAPLGLIGNSRVSRRFRLLLCERVRASDGNHAFRLQLRCGFVNIRLIQSGELSYLNVGQRFRCSSFGALSATASKLGSPPYFHMFLCPRSVAKGALFGVSRSRVSVPPSARSGSQ